MAISYRLGHLERGRLCAAWRVNLPVFAMIMRLKV